MGQLGVGAPVCRASDLLGSHRTVDSLANRDAILSTLRDEGMTVWVVNAASVYRLVGGITNGNWVLDGTVGGALVRDYTGAVNPGDVVYQNGVANEVGLADAAAVATGTPMGVAQIVDVPSVGKCVVSQAGDIGGFAGLTIGAPYVLASGVPGEIELASGGAAYPDTTPGSGEVLSPVGVAKSATELTVNVGAGIVAEF
jgi:hypothetical protein